MLGIIIDGSKIKINHMESVNLTKNNKSESCCELLLLSLWKFISRHCVSKSGSLDSEVVRWFSHKALVIDLIES